MDVQGRHHCRTQRRAGQLTEVRRQGRKGRIELAVVAGTAVIFPVRFAALQPARKTRQRPIEEDD
eukprot:2076733-Alexandrium_andersonii.AAC.1